MSEGDKCLITSYFFLFCYGHLDDFSYFDVIFREFIPSAMAVRVAGTGTVVKVHLFRFKYSL